jgi:hypothetical protein
MPVFERGDEGLDHLGILEVAVELASSILRLFKYKGKAVKRRPFIR